MNRIAQGGYLPLNLALTLGFLVVASAVVAWLILR
jgi:hypothetical protein